jgi:hypothetical protein
MANPIEAQNNIQRGDLVHPHRSAPLNRKNVKQAAIGTILATKLAVVGVRTWRKWVCSGKELNPKAKKWTKYVVPQKKMAAAVRSVVGERVVNEVPKKLSQAQVHPCKTQSCIKVRSKSRHIFRGVGSISKRKITAQHVDLDSNMD